MKTVTGGVHCVPFALFDESGKLDRGAMRDQFQLMLDLGVDGFVVLGLATEVQKLDQTEQKQVISWAAEDIVDQVSLSVTINGNSVAQQREMTRFALDHGAACMVLQPPAVGNYSGDTYIDFFAQVAEGFDTAFAIQNAPQYLGSALTDAQVTTLQTRNQGFSVIKAEVSALELAGLVGSLEHEMTVLNGRGGLELTDCLRAGADGFVLAPDMIDHSKKAFDFWQAGDHIEAEVTYGEVLPAIVFAMQSIEHLICYGKRIFGHRSGIPIHDRAPALRSTEYGENSARNWADRLGSLTG